MTKSLADNKKVLDEGALYKTLCQDLRHKIVSREVQPGEKLPSISALCQRYGVSTITVRAAVRELVNEGLLESRPRSGLYVKPSTAANVPSTQGGILENAITILTTILGPWPGHNQSGWLHHITSGAQNAARETGFHSVVLHHDRLINDELRQFALSRPRVIVLTDREHAYEFPHVIKLINELDKCGVRPTLYGSSPDWGKYDRVVSDHASGAYQLAQWLMQRGCRRIVNIWPLDSSGYWYPARYEGYSRALEEAGLMPEPPLCIIEDVEMEMESIKRSVRNLAGHLIEYLGGDNPADGLMVHTDADYYRIAAACRLFGREPGKDIQIVGYDNIWLDCDGRQWEASAPQATIDKRNHHIGAELVKLLLQRERGELPPKPQCRIVEPQLMETALSPVFGLKTPLSTDMTSKAYSI